MTDIYTLLRKNSTGILYLIYAVWTLIYFDKDIITFSSLGILLALILSIRFFSKSEKTLFKKFGFVLFSFILVYYDNIFIPDLLPYFRATYLVIAIALILMFLKFKFGANRLIAPFLGINLFFILILNIFREKNPEFSVNKNPDNLVYHHITEPARNKKNILLVILDGYPSKRSLTSYNNIQTGLDSILPNFQYTEFNTKYTSTPLSITNILFGAEYDPEMKGLSLRQDEIKLFNDALERSSLKNQLENYDSKWLSFLYSKKNSDILGFSFWRIICFRSADKVFSYKVLKLLGFDVSHHFYNNKILAYNNSMFSNFKNAVKEQKKPKFILLHYLTFHRLLPMDTLYRYADSIMSETIKITPKDYTIMVFSDHGNREKYVDEKDKNSGIFYSNILDSLSVK